MTRALKLPLFLTPNPAHPWFVLSRDSTALRQFLGELLLDGVAKVRNGLKVLSEMVTKLEVLAELISLVQLLHLQQLPLPLPQLLLQPRIRTFSHLQPLLVANKTLLLLVKYSNQELYGKLS